MRVHVISDMEGVGGIVKSDQTNAGRPMFEEGRKLYTEELIGNEGFSGLASLLLTSRPGLAMHLKKGGVVALGFHAGPEQGAGELLWSLTPKTLRLLGG